MNIALSSETIVRVWEEGQTQHPIDRALTLLSLVRPGVPRRSLARLAIGRRDTMLLEMRKNVFGPELQLFATCPACAEQLELDLDARDMLARSDPEDDSTDVVLRREWDDWVVEFGLPNSLDLAFALQAEQESSEIEAARALASRCVIGVEKGGERLGPEAVSQLPQLLMKQIEAAIAEADPNAEILLNLTCPACGERFQELFDIVTHLWDEISAYAKDIAYETHLLARYYGWSEREILAMSEHRRQTYLGMIG